MLELDKRDVINAASATFVFVLVASYATAVASCGFEGPGNDATKTLTMQRNIFACCFACTYFGMCIFMWMAWKLAPPVRVPTQTVATEEQHHDAAEKED